MFDIFTIFCKRFALMILFLLGALYAGTTFTSAQTVNLIPNPSLETPNVTNPNQPQDWQPNWWGTLIAAHTYVNNDGADGSRSVKVDITSYTSGDAKWIFAPVTIQPNTRYVFSDFYKSNVQTRVLARIYDTSGQTSYSAVASAPAAATWTKVQGTFTTPSNASKVAIYHLIDKIGFLQMDNFSLQPAQSVSSPSPTATPTPPTNASVSLYTDALTTGWLNWSFGVTANFSNTTPVFVGSRSIAFTVTQPWGALYFRNNTGVDTGVFQSVQFSMRATQANQSYLAFFKDANGADLTKVRLADFGGDPQVGVWKTYTIPIASLTTTNRLVKGFLIQDRLGKTQPTAYVDEVKLISTQSPTPTPNPSIVPGKFNRPLITITFDDSTQSEYTHGLPILQKYGLKGTFYVISGRIGQDAYYMTADQIRAVRDAGNELGSHTVTHPRLTQLPFDQMTNELVQSKNDLTTLFGVAIRNFASPYGDHNETVLGVVRQHYRSHRSVFGGLNTKSNFNKYVLLQRAPNDNSYTTLQTWLAETKQNNGWLILLYHTIDPTYPRSTSGNVLPVEFDRQMQLLKDSGIPVVTVDQALDELEPQL